MDISKGIVCGIVFVGDLFAIHRQHAGTTLSGSWSVVLEVEYDRVLARAEGRQAFPAKALQVKKVVNKHRSASADSKHVRGKHGD